MLRPADRGHGFRAEATPAQIAAWKRLWDWLLRPLAPGTVLPDSATPAAASARPEEEQAAS